MANDDRERGDRPSLEPPSLALFRRGRRGRKSAPPASPAPLDAGAEPAAGGAPISDTTPAADPGSAVPPEDPATEADARSTTVPATASGTEEQEAASADEDSTGLSAAAADESTAVAADPVVEDTTRSETPHRGAAASATASAPRLFADEVPATPPRGGTDTAHLEPAETPSDQAGSEPRAPRPPVLTGIAAAVFTGAFIGVLVVGLTAGSLQLCEVVQGTSSCGGPGFFLLLAILVASVLLGGALLRLFRVPDPGSTSFLAVGLLTVIGLLFLVEVLFAWWMIIVIPACGAATFALSHWVTTTFIDSGDD